MPSCGSPRTAATGTRRQPPDGFHLHQVRGPLAERCAEFAWKGCKLAASGDFETITFADEPERQPGFLIKATEVEFLSPRRVEESAASMPADGMDEAAAERHAEYRH